MEEIKGSLRRFLAESILFCGNQFPYGDDVSFLGNGIIDSMNVMEIVYFVEHQFEIKVEDEDIVPANFDTIERLASFITEKKEARFLS